MRLLSQDILIYIYMYLYGKIDSSHQILDVFIVSRQFLVRDMIVIERQRESRGGVERGRRVEGSKNIVYCSKWAVTRSCVTTSSIAHKGSSTEKAEARQRQNDVRFL